MRLNKLFMLSTAVLLTLVSIMLARSLLSDWRLVQAAQTGLQELELAYLTMKAAEKGSAERGPTIPVLNDTVPADPAKRARLDKARAASDEAFTAALSGLSQSKDKTTLAALAVVQRAQQQLLQARKEVDRVAALSFEERTAPGSRIRRVPIDQMFGVIDVTLEGVTLLTSETLRIYPELSQPVEGARLGAILREYAGRLGSQFTSPLAAAKPLIDSERNDIYALVGRVDQLRQLLGMQAQTNPDEPRVKKALDEVDARYFGKGLPLIMSLTAAGIEGKPYGMDSSQFVGKYVPEMASIIGMRDIMFEVAKSGAAVRVEEAKRNLRINALIGSAVILVEILVFVMVRKRVLQPLLQSTRAVVAIADGKLEEQAARSTRTDEIGDLQNALTGLRETSLKKQSLEHEREALIGKLELASNTALQTQRKPFWTAAIPQPR
jgi:hypothetical protein